MVGVGFHQEGAETLVVLSSFIHRVRLGTEERGGGHEKGFLISGDESCLMMLPLTTVSRLCAGSYRGRRRGNSRRNRAAHLRPPNRRGDRSVHERLHKTLQPRRVHRTVLKAELSRVRRHHCNDSKQSKVKSTLNHLDRMFTSIEY